MTQAATRHLTIAFALLGLAGTSPAWAAISITRSSSFAYDPASGLLTQEVVEPNTQSLRLETDYAYDAFGNKLSATVSGVDIATRGSSTTYDSKGQFAVSASNALGQSESWAYDARFGVPTSHTGPNGLTTTWGYDSFGRKTLETRADGTQTKYAYLFCSGFNGGTASCPSGAVYLTQATPYASGGTTQNGPQSTSYFDQLGRAIASDSQGFDGSLIRATTQYDSLMRVQQMSRPFFVSSGTPVYTVPSYDALNRVIKTTFPDGSTAQVAYHGLSITTTNALGQTNTTVKNDQGLVASVTDAAGKVTSYTYDPLGNAIKTTDPAGNVTTATYDTRGRKVSMSDADMGSWSYTYDTASELTSQTDAKSQATTFQYDLLGRLTQRVEPDMTCNWAYDTAIMGIGKLASAAVTSGPSNGYQRSYTYDSLGRPSQIAITVDGVTYTTATTYDANGRVSTSTYASGFTVQYGYTSLGYQNQLLNNATGQVYWTANTFDASLHLLQQTAGNGVVTNQTFDPNTGRLTAIEAGSSGAVENFAYVYDTLGNVSSRANNGAGLSETFQYDALNRLTSSTITGSTANPPAKSFAYDALGNITMKSDVGNYTYPAAGAPQPHAVTSISGATISATFTYDVNGNQTAGLGRSIGYSSYNMPQSITQGTINVSFTHDTEHQRLKKIDTTNGTVTTTLYLGAAEKVTSASGSVTWNEYLSTPGGLIAVRLDAVTAGTVTTRYLHHDGLGSVSVLTDENATVVQRISYDPWGKQRNPSTWSDDPTGSLPTQDQTTRGFTGQEQLEDVGLVHMNARVYDPQIGRFLSADSIVQDAYNAQSLNRYTYVYDNPLAYTDPSGHCFLGLCHAGHAIASFLTGGLSGGIKKSLMLQLSPLPWINPIGAGLPLQYISPLNDAFNGFVRSNPLAQEALTFGAAIAGAIVTPFCGCGFLIVAANAAYLAGVNGGTLGSMLEAGAIAGGEAAAFNLAGTYTTGLANIAAHAAIGCAVTAASGGSCGAGALSAGVGALATPIINAQFPHAAFQDPNFSFGDLAGGTAETAVLSGFASVAGGGKFANGAITGAFGYLFNNLQDHSGLYRGTAIGTGAGLGLAGACDLGTVGACVLANPLIVGLGAGVGMIGGQIGDTLQSLYDTMYHSDSVDANSENPDVPRLDGTGKVHGELPSSVPNSWTDQQLEELQTDLQTSIGNREQEQLNLGEDGAHRARIDDERRLLNQINNKLNR